MPKEDNKILKYNRGRKSMKVLFIIYAYLESLTEKMSTYSNKKLSITKINKNTATVIHCLHNVQLMQQKMSLIVI